MIWIVDLYGESIIEFDRLCSDHIKKRIEESKNRTGMPTKLWEHACILIVHAQRIYAKQLD